MNNSPHRVSSWPITLTVILAAEVFVADLVLPLGLAAWLPYAALMLISLWAPYRLYTPVVATAYTVLIVLGYFLSPLAFEGMAPAQSILNRGLGVLVIWLTALLCQQRNRAEESLRQSEVKYRSIVETTAEWIWEINREWRITYTNSAVKTILGYNPEELVGKDGLMLIHEKDRQSVEKLLPQLMANKSGWSAWAMRWRHKEGGYRYLESNATPILNASGELVGYLASDRDITERKRAEEERERLLEQVHAGRERLQALSRQLVAVQEVERRHLARELHDEIGQMLTGIKLTLEMSTRVPVDAVKTTLVEAQVQLNDLMARVRKLSLDLRPAMLDDLGLVPALLWHFERYTAQTHVRVAFQHSGLEGRFAPEIETAAYRIVQEALTNVARHAGVNEVAVRLWSDQRILGVEIQDRGTGFDPEATLAASTTGGLTGMHERVALLGGHLTVEAAPRAGTRLTAELPLTARIEKRKRPTWP